MISTLYISVCVHEPALVWAVHKMFHFDVQGSKKARANICSILRLPKSSFEQKIKNLENRTSGLVVRVEK